MFGWTILLACSITNLHYRRMRRCVVITTAACFAISLRGNCSRWEHCLHAGGAVVQICREFIVCWPQCSSTGSFCATAAKSDPYPAPHFAHFFWQDRKSGSAKQPLQCHCKRGSSVTTGKAGPAKSSAPTERRQRRPCAACRKNARRRLRRQAFLDIS